MVDLNKIKVNYDLLEGDVMSADEIPEGEYFYDWSEECYDVYTYTERMQIKTDKYLCRKRGDGSIEFRNFNGVWILWEIWDM